MERYYCGYDFFGKKASQSYHLTIVRGLKSLTVYRVTLFMKFFPMGSISNISVNSSSVQIHGG